MISKEMSRLEQIKSLTAAFAKSMKTGKIRSSEELRAERLAIYVTCEKFMDRGNRVFKCEICGCGVKRKISVQGSECPIGKW